jgi:hypothetical protein
MNKIIYIGTSQEYLTDYYCAHVAWDMQGTEFYPYVLKRKFQTRAAAQRYGRAFKIRWEKLHG